MAGSVLASFAALAGLIHARRNPARRRSVERAPHTCSSTCGPPLCLARPFAIDAPADLPPDKGQALRLSTPSFTVVTVQGDLSALAALLPPERRALLVLAFPARGLAPLPLGA